MKRKYPQKTIPRRGTCENSGKYIFTKRNAKAMLKKARKLKCRREKSYYWCSHCNGYHVSSYPFGEYEERRREARAAYQGGEYA